MNSRERVLASLNHRQPDKVAIDFGGHRSSGIAAIAYRQLRQELGLPPRAIRVYDPLQQIAVIDDDVLCSRGVASASRPFWTGDLLGFDLYLGQLGIVRRLVHAAARRRK